MRVWPYLLFVLPLIALMWVPSYNSLSPELMGIPFYYWYQFLWVFITAGLTAVVYALTGEHA